MTRLGVENTCLPSSAATTVAVRADNCVMLLPFASSNRTVGGLRSCPTKVLLLSLPPHTYDSYKQCVAVPPHWRMVPRRRITLISLLRLRPEHHHVWHRRQPQEHGRVGCMAQQGGEGWPRRARCGARRQREPRAACGSLRCVRLLLLPSLFGGFVGRRAAAWVASWCMRETHPRVQCLEQQQQRTHADQPY